MTYKIGNPTLTAAGGGTGMTEMFKSRWDEIGLSDDFIFGKVMQKPKLCKKLLQMILPELDIDYIEYPEWQKEFRSDMDTKGDSCRCLCER